MGLSVCQQGLKANLDVCQILAFLIITVEELSTPVSPVHPLSVDLLLLSGHTYIKWIFVSALL